MTFKYIQNPIYDMDEGRRIVTATVGAGLAHLATGPLGGLFNAYGEEPSAIANYLAAEGYRMEGQRPAEPAVLLFGDAHKKAEWEKEASVFKELHRTYGVEAFGFEGVYGSPRPQILKEVNQELAAVFGGSTTFKARVKKGDNSEMVDLPYVDTAPLDTFAGFLDRQDVPSFGLEKKELYLQLMGLTALETIMEYLSVMKKAGVTEIPSYGDVVHAAESIQKRFPNAPYPAKTIHEMADRWGAMKTAFDNNDQNFFDRGLATLLSYQTDLRDKRRTRAMAEAIELQLRTYKKIAASVGYNHLNAKYLDPQGIRPVQNMLSRPTLVIDAQLHE